MNHDRDMPEKALPESRSVAGAGGGDDNWRGPWLPTASGGKWYLLFPDPADVRICDIAAGLARTCRYGGQISPEIDMLSVSEHSVRMTWHAIDRKIAVTREDALEILLHDSPESYIREIPSPLKRMLPGYKEIEARSEAAIRQAFGLTGEVPAFVKELDRAIVLDERDFAIVDATQDWEADRRGIARLGVKHQGWGPREAMRQFLETYLECENMPSRNVGNTADQRNQEEIAAAIALLDRLHALEEDVPYSPGGQVLAAE